MITFVSFFLSFSLAIALYAQSPQLSLQETAPQTIDQVVPIQIKDLSPFQKITLEARAKDQKGEVWSSQATYLADAYGLVDLALAKPVDGSSYSEADAMGLFWSMLPFSGDDAVSFKCAQDAFTVEIQLSIDGKCIECKTITRYLKLPDVQKIDIRDKGLVGTLFLPKCDMPLPLIITLSGSNGGLGENRAKLIASRGFAVLALGYFGVEDLPSHLQNIPLEYFETAIAWIKDHPAINPSRIGIYGASRGGELALILGSFFPDSIQAIAAIVPSSVCYGGLSETPVDAWTYQSKPIQPFAPVPKTDFTNGKGQSAHNPANTSFQFIEGMKDKNAFAAAAIAVEKIRCPILLISGGDDQMWPSEIYAGQILERLQKTKSSILCRHVNYPEAGHGIHIPYLPTPGPTYYHPVGKLWLTMGGSRAADAKASADAWNQIIAFFHESLYR